MGICANEGTFRPFYGTLKYGGIFLFRKGNYGDRNDHYQVLKPCNQSSPPPQKNTFSFSFLFNGYIEATSAKTPSTTLQ